MIKITELRTGNLLNYDTAEGGILPTKIDWQDLKWLDEDAKGFNLVYTPIPITEEWLLKLGAQHYKNRKDMFNLSGITVVIDKDKDLMCIKGNLICELILCHLKFVHQVQNFYFGLVGIDLIIQSLVGGEKNKI
ncbi:MAG: hypothetical protein AABY22_30985 [Nanoarchaeota archaeon]